MGDIIIPVRLDTVTLKEDNTELQQALFDFMTASGFITVASTDLAGAVTCNLDKAPINDVLDKVATSVNGKWQPVYLLSLPRILTDAEVEARTEARFQSQWSAYWAKSPADRKADLQNRIDGLNRMAEMAKQNPQMAARMQNRGSRMLSRLERYSATLSMEQRREIMPMVQALGAAVHNH